MRTAAAVYQGLATVVHYAAAPYSNSWCRCSRCYFPKRLLLLSLLSWNSHDSPCLRWVHVQMGIDRHIDESSDQQKASLPRRLDNHCHWLEPHRQGTLKCIDVQHGQRTVCRQSRPHTLRLDLELSQQGTRRRSHHLDWFLPGTRSHTPWCRDLHKALELDRRRSCCRHQEVARLGK